MKKRKLLALAICTALVLTLSACFRVSNSGNDNDDETYDASSYDYDDDLDDSSSDEETTEYGNDEVGWLTLDGDFYKWFDPDAPVTCVQYAKSPSDIYTMNYYNVDEVSAQLGMDYNAEIAAKIQYIGTENESATTNIEELTIARVKLGEYDAYQVYCYYPDDTQYLVTWFMDSADGQKVYYLAAEFLDTDMDFFHYSESYRMPEPNA